jgi:hypothetical protein
VVNIQACDSPFAMKNRILDSSMSQESKNEENVRRKSMHTHLNDQANEDKINEKSDQQKKFRSLNQVDSPKNDDIQPKIMLNSKEDDLLLSKAAKKITPFNSSNGSIFKKANSKEEIQIRVNDDTKHTISVRKKRKTFIKAQPEESKLTTNREQSGKTLESNQRSTITFLNKLMKKSSTKQEFNTFGKLSGSKSGFQFYNEEDL